jgi:hypothetical protein
MGGRGRWISEFEVSLVYRVSSRTARAIQRNPVSKKKKKKKPQKEKEKKEEALDRPCEHQRYSPAHHSHYTTEVPPICQALASPYSTTWSPWQL